MRENKFRMWDTNNKKWLDFSYLLHPEKGTRVDDGSPDTILTFKAFQDKGYIINQYTGLKDKNGVEIYEDDFVRLTDDWDDEGTVHQVKYFGDYDYPAFDLEPSIDAESNGLSHYKGSGDIEVIGNIHENPELLK